MLAGTARLFFVYLPEPRVAQTRVIIQQRSNVVMASLYRKVKYVLILFNCIMQNGKIKIIRFVIITKPFIARLFSLY